MEIVNFIVILSAGMLLCTCVSYLSFIDYLGVLFKIFPIPKPKDYDKHREFIKSEQYQKHKKKWRCLFSLNAFVYALIYVLVTLFTKSDLYGFLLGLFGAAVGIGITGNFEIRKRKVIRQQINMQSNTKRRNTGDSSVS